MKQDIKRIKKELFAMSIMSEDKEIHKLLLEARKPLNKLSDLLDNMNENRLVIEKSNRLRQALWDDLQMISNAASYQVFYEGKPFSDAFYEYVYDGKIEKNNYLTSYELKQDARLPYLWDLKLKFNHNPNLDFKVKIFSNKVVDNNLFERSKWELEK